MKTKRPLGYAIVEQRRLRALLGGLADGFNARDGYAIVGERTLMDCAALHGGFAARAAALGGVALNGGEPQSFVNGGIAATELLRRYGVAAEEPVNPEE